MPSSPPILIVLLHGAGETPEAMQALRAMISMAMPDVLCVAPAAALEADTGAGGRQWFSVAGITEESRPGRVVGALPAFVTTIRTLQAEHGLGAERTILAGFSQGASMSLQASEHSWLARHIVAISGRFAPLPLRWPHACGVTLVHGRMDLVVGVAHSVQAEERLRQLGAQVVLERVPRAIHRLSSPLLEAAADAVVRAADMVRRERTGG